MKIYNTMTASREEFISLEPGIVKMYVCGVTVYDACHIGHARSAVIFDVIRKYFKYKGYIVKFVKNFTDIDDKIIIRANKEGKDFRDISEKYIEKYRVDMKYLGVDDGDVEPRATDHISDMIQIIKILIEKGYAYEVDGDVYFEVSKFSKYGKLSQKPLEELQAGIRVEVDERKKSPLDFALWKKSKEGEPFWESSWGYGRPGWHIECSAMSLRYLGESFDIHGGGEDLIFPHHENEIAQSEAYTEKSFAKYWIHNGFVNISHQKMSKSLGNVLTIEEISKKYPSEALRLFLLSTHYRKPLDYMEDRLRESWTAISRIYSSINKAEILINTMESNHGEDKDIIDKLKRKEEREFIQIINEIREEFEDSMDDDFNTPQAIAAIFELVKNINIYIANIDEGKGLHIYPLRIACNELRKLGRILGILREDRRIIIEGERARLMDSLLKQLVEVLIELRAQAREEKDYKKADLIREKLAKIGIILEDSKSGTSWRIEELNHDI